MQLLILNYLDSAPWWLNLSLLLCSLLYFCDLVLHILHRKWLLVRINIRTKRRNLLTLVFDAVTLMMPSFWIDIYTLQPSYLKYYAIVSRWLEVLRIYRYVVHFWILNAGMQSHRKLLYMFEHVSITALVLHGAACLWFQSHRTLGEAGWGTLQYPMQGRIDNVAYDTYLSCWYYAASRLCNVIFGDTYPLTNRDKWVTTAVMLVGFVLSRYTFIGLLSSHLVNEESRRVRFIDQYHHMARCLKQYGAPRWLAGQALRYKRELWTMKQGVVESAHVSTLPLPLQRELIFDINIKHFQRSLLFRDTDEAFLRQLSLLFQHQVYLEGQVVWAQGVVKGGLVCVRRGVVELLSEEDDESPMIAFGEGTVLGELSLFYSIPAKVTIKAATYVEIQLLKRTDFMRAMSEQPALLQEIRKKINQRLENSKTRQEQIENYEEGDSRLIRTRYRPMKVLKDFLTGVEEEYVAFSDDSHMYYRDVHNERKPKFTSEYLDLYNISHNVTTVDVPRICLKSSFPWILEPDTSFTIMFDVVHVVMILYVCTVLPYAVIFRPGFFIWEPMVTTIAKIGLVLQIYIQLTTAIITKNTKLVTVKEIAEAKMATAGFYLDILSVFPLSIFCEFFDEDRQTVLVQLAQICPMLQFWHVWDYMNKWDRNFYSNLKLMCVVKYAITYVIFAYWSSCFLFLFACPRDICVSTSWMSQLMYLETKVLVISQAKHEHALAASMFLGTSVLTGAGQADVTPGRSDLPWIIIMILVGLYLSSFYTAKLCSIYILLNQRKLMFKESMRELFYFLSSNHVSSKIKSRVEKFFRAQWYYNSAVSNEEIFGDMSADIQQEVLYIEMVETLLTCPLFQGCSRDWLQTAAARARCVLLPAGELLQHAADIGRDIYVLQKGHCNILNHTGKIVSSAGPGTNFGVMEMLYGLPKVYTVVTTTACSLLHLEYSALVQCLSIFPDVMEPIAAVIEDVDLERMASKFVEAKPLSGRLDAKVNRIAQEIKESFVILNNADDRSEYVAAFNTLGIMRFLRYLVIPGCITPHGIFLKLWCGLRFFVAVYYIVTGPYNIATQKHQFPQNPSTDWVDIVLYCDMVLMSYVGYYDARSLLITHPLLTITHYLKHAFWLDLVTVFPVEEVFRLVNYESSIDIYRINRLLQIFRITGAFYYLESDIMRLNQAIVLFRFLPIAVTIVNLATALVFMDHCTPFMTPNNTYIMVTCCRQLVTGKENVEYFAVSEYINTFNWIYSMFFGCGCTITDISSRGDMVVVSGLVLVGCLYFGLMYGHAAAARAAATAALLTHVEKTRDLYDFLYQNNVEPMLTEKTLKYFEYVWKRTKGSNPQQICRQLNSALMEDTLVSIYERTLREVPLFAAADRSFIRVVTQHLQEMYFLKGETVLQCKDVQGYVYIIYRGKVDVLSSYNEMITCMGPGGMFGNFTGQSLACSEVSIYASRSLDLLVIPSQTFFNLIKYYPKIQAPLKKAFERSKDYIMPISMDVDDDASSDSEGTADDVAGDAQSTHDSRSGSVSDMSRERINVVSISMRSSQSNLSQSRSGASVSTLQNFSPFNLLIPGSLMFQYFGYLMCFVSTLNYVLVLYDLVSRHQCLALYWLHYPIDVLSYLQVYVSMHAARVNKRGELMLEPQRCRRAYFSQRWQAWSDLVANLPLEPICFAFTPPSSVLHYTRANKLLRIKYLLEFYKKTSKELTNNLTTLNIVVTVCVATALLHSAVCVWLAYMLATAPACVVRTYRLRQLDDLLQRRWDYTTSFYVLISEFTSAGGEEFSLSGLVPFLILGILLSSGKVLAAITVATSMQLTYSTQFALNIYEKRSKELVDMLKNQGLSNFQLSKLLVYIRQLWQTERGRQLPALIRQTPYVRRCDLMAAMFGQHLRNCYIFADTGEPFLRQLTVLLDYTIFFPGNYIVVAGDSDARMFWLHAGVVSVVSATGVTETKQELLRPGDTFGVIQGLNRGVPHCFSYKAETKVSVLSLSLDAWRPLLPFFPTAQRKIMDRAELLFTDQIL
ncbi:uncharacterized protein LOC105394666 [Plutella xylostella]|uniref:uncharacterized protein LOC105394666 n=1 Tax=Plutella xylostella TaxID=51655 RepID=UPI002032D9D3|nr:uncharacterized protein LOC105394666 [Plutella xylostella]